MNFNKNASTYVRTQTSLLIGRPEQQRSCPENRPERFQPRDWKDSSDNSEDSYEDSCDTGNDEDFCILL